MRNNIFYAIHKALRAMLYETGLKLQRTDFGNEEESEELLNDLSTAIDMFEKHAHTEDNLVFPAVSLYEPSVIDSFEKEHTADHELSEKLRALIQMFGSVQTDVEKLQLGSALRKAFVEFMIFNLEHMAREEMIINSLLWRYYSDEQISAIQDKIIASQTPETANAFAIWMLRGLSNSEIIHWLRKMEKTAPESVFNSVFSLSEAELPHRRFQLVVEGLSEGVMLA